MSNSPETTTSGCVCANDARAYAYELLSGAVMKAANRPPSLGTTLVCTVPAPLIAMCGAGAVQAPNVPLSKPSAKATGSTDQVELAGLASTLPAASVARTWTVCAPSVSPLYCYGDVQLAQAPASSAHSNVAVDSS